MSVRSCIGNLLDDDAEALIDPVNCVGVMDRGLALQFRRRWPAHHAAYVEACKRRQIRPGALLITHAADTKQRLVAFPTKRHWSEKSRLDDIEAGLLALREFTLDERIVSIAVPPLGCGLGGLDWHRVRPRIVAALGNAPVEARLYEPIPQSGVDRSIDAIDRGGRHAFNGAGFGRVALRF
ncbi:MAG: macro domain-containing protein [Proteobacteria bacterium]|nr:macro domain-containing protein [Pseudomonadota bacterium]MBI3496272.1 macro domain-containing protein [Pseudomonadota bacterium]